MKKSVVIIIGVILCLGILATIGANAQSIDQGRMDRDLQVASTILKTKLQGDRGMYFGGSRDIEGDYMEGFGVIFTMEANNIFFAPEVEVADVKVSTGVREDRDEERVARAESRPRGAVAIGGFSSERVDHVEKIKEFLVDYSHLIGQLKPADRIAVKQKSRSDLFYTYTIASGEVSSTNSGNVSLEIKVSDVNDFRSGKLNREEALDKVKVIKEEEVKLEEDVRLFGNIIRTVYESSVSSTYFMSDRPRVERVNDFGAIYTMKFYSSNPMGFGDKRFHQMPTLKLKDVPQADRDKKVQELYPAFLKSLKENMVEYGRTISSLDNDEKVIIKASLTTCEGCGIPVSIELAVSNSTLQEYSSGKITKSTATSRVTVKENGKQ